MAETPWPRAPEICAGTRNWRPGRGRKIRPSQTKVRFLGRGVFKGSAACSLTEASKFGRLDCELSVRLTMASSSVSTTMRGCYVKDDAYLVVSEPCDGATLRKQLQVRVFRVIDKGELRWDLGDGSDV